MRALLAALIVALAATAASAIFVRSQMERLDPEPLYDSEYFIDVLSFAYPLDWQEVWRSTNAPVRYRVNGASLDCCSLLLSQDLLWRKALTENLEMRFRYFQDDDKEFVETHHWLELERRLGAGFSAELFGEPSFDKGDADIGVGAAWRGAGALVFVRRHLVDFSFNRRSATEERYARKPITDQVGVSWGPVSARVELDHPAAREAALTGRAYSYRRTRAAAAARLGPVLLDYLYEFQKEGDRFAPGFAGVPLDYARQAHRARIALARGAYEAGHVFLARSARADRPDDGAASTRYRRWEAQPYARWRPPLTETLTGELAAFLTYGGNVARRGQGAVSSYDAVLEAKLGAGLDVEFTPSARMGFYTTWDLDSAVAHPWDGGNIRAMVLF